MAHDSPLTSSFDDVTLNVFQHAHQSQHIGPLGHNVIVLLQSVRQTPDKMAPGFIILLLVLPRVSSYFSFWLMSLVLLEKHSLL